MAETKKNLPRVTVLLQPEEFDRLTAHCTETGHKKSTLVARLIREYLAREVPEAKVRSRRATPRRSKSKRG